MRERFGARGIHIPHTFPIELGAKELLRVSQTFGCSYLGMVGARHHIRSPVTLGDPTEAKRVKPDEMKLNQGGLLTPVLFFSRGGRKPLGSELMTKSERLWFGKDIYSLLVSTIHLSPLHV